MRQWLTFGAVCFASAAAAALEVTPLEKSGHSWDGSAYVYPQGDAEITAIKILMEPSEIADFHCHPMPTLGYVVSGHLEVETLGGKRQTFRAGESILEVAGRWHRGVNLSIQSPVELVVFYAGVKGQKTTLLLNDETKHLCVE